MAGGICIGGIGIIHWTFIASDGSNLVIRMQCYYMPEAKARLISPHQLFKAVLSTTASWISPTIHQSRLSAIQRATFQLRMVAMPFNTLLK
jgi:hypothetical protein